MTPFRPSEGWQEVTEGQYGTAAGEDLDRIQLVLNGKCSFWIRKEFPQAVETNRSNLLRAYLFGMNHTLGDVDRAEEYITKLFR